MTRDSQNIFNPLKQINMTNLNTNIDEWDVSETGYITQDEMDEVISSIEKQETRI